MQKFKNAQYEDSSAFDKLWYLFEEKRDRRKSQAYESPVNMGMGSIKNYFWDLNPSLLGHK